MIDDMTQVELEALHSCLIRRIAYQKRLERIMRTISEAQHFAKYVPSLKGRYVMSREGKTLNPVVSQEAARLMSTTSDKWAFSSATILEHPWELKRIYNALMKHPQDVGAALCRYPLVTVTEVEDQELKRLEKLKKLDPAADWTTPAERYTRAGIKVGRVKEVRFGEGEEIIDWQEELLL
jgi:hypothetical protein